MRAAAAGRTGGARRREVTRLGIRRAGEKDRNSLRDERGSVIVFVALAMTVLLGFAALVIDLGVLYFNRVLLSNAADAAALAGVQELPDYPDDAPPRALEYAAVNGADPARTSAAVMADGHSIGVATSRIVGLGFAKALGFPSSVVVASAKARVGSVSGVQGAVPLGVVQQEFVFGESYILKYGSDGGCGGGCGPRHGNFGGLALGGRGACVYRNNLKYGYSGILHIGDEVETEPGNMSGPTVDGVSYRISGCTHTPRCTYDHFVKGCPRVALVPVIESFEGVHGRDTVVIVGFAAFFLEEGTGHGKDCEVRGRFVRMVVDAEVEDTADFGLVSYRLEE